MLQKEFEERIGRSVSEEEYVEANAMYMAAGDIDKDTFCREWKRIGESPLVAGLFGSAYNLGKEVQELKLMHQESTEIISDAADAMLEVADGLLSGRPAADAPGTVASAVMEGSAIELTKKAWWLVGQKEVTRRRVEKGYQLDARDKETIINHLK